MRSVKVAPPSASHCLASEPFEVVGVHRRSSSRRRAVAASERHRPLECAHDGIVSCPVGTRHPGYSLVEPGVFAFRLHGGLAGVSQGSSRPIGAQ
jgi:hypothetical protein